MGVLSVRSQKLFSSSISKVSIAIVLMILCSRVKIPLFYVPITLQTMAVYLIAIRLCPREAFASILGYLAIGCLGVPVWAHAGAGLFSATTAGYLIGMLTAAPLISYMFRKGVSGMVSCILGSLIIKLCGVLWLLNIMDIKSAMLCGFLPFILPAILKINAALSINSFLARES